MATISKKSLLTYPQLLVLMVVTLIVASCNNQPKGDGVWIPVPPDTSALGKIDHFIPIGNIERYRNAFRAERDTLSKKEPSLYFTKSEAFNKRYLLEMLKNPKCVGLKVYYGVKTGKENDFRCMIVGVDEQGKDLYISKTPQAGAQASGETGGLEYGQCAPPCTVDPSDQ